MCKSLAEGGGRCEYADAVANVRRKALYKNQEEYDIARFVEKDVNKWKAANSELVENHLPKNQSFNTTPGTAPIPKKLLDMFAKKSREPVTGLNKEDRIEYTKALHADYKKWEEALSREEDNAIRSYSMTSYEFLNRTLRRTGIAAWYKENRHFRNAEMPKRVKKETVLIDAALKKAPQAEEPRKVYRYYELPPGVSAATFMEKYLEPGSGFQDKGYMSTSADPELTMAAINHRQLSHPEKKFIVLEIITKQGGSLQTRDRSNGGDIQSCEKEILLPRNIKMRVAGIRKRQSFMFSSDRKDLYERMGGPNTGWISSEESSYQRWGKYKTGEKMNLPLVQLVDEKLIKEIGWKSA